MGRILGLDYGRRRIGVAVSDPLELTAQPVETWEGLSFAEVVERICTLVEKMNVERVVVGLPLTLKGERGSLAREVERFTAELCHSIRVPVTLWDERMTSVQAHRSLRKMGKKPSRKKERIDLIASIFLLQSYLDHQKVVSVKHHGEGD